MLEVIKEDVPNIPEEVIRLWLLPFAEDFGWPPNSAWGFKLGREPIEFWNDAKWKKEKRDLSKIPYARGYYDAMRGLFGAYIFGESNLYSQTLGQNGKRRFHRSYEYILKNRVFPQPPIIYPNELEKFEIMDGNHRFLAIVAATRTWEDFEKLEPVEQVAFLQKIGLEKLLPPHDVQEIWIAYPNWGDSKGAQSRGYLRDVGIDI